MTMLNKLMEDLKTSMKEKDVPRKETVQLIIAKAKSLAKDALVEVEDSHIMTSINSELKQTKEALDMMKNNISQEKIDEYKYKIGIITGYLPKQLDESEIKKEVEMMMYELDLPKEPKSMGILMKNLKAKLGDTVEGKVLSEAVKEALK